MGSAAAVGMPVIAGTFAMKGVAAAVDATVADGLPAAAASPAIVGKHAMAGSAAANGAGGYRCRLASCGGLGFGSAGDGSLAGNTNGCICAAAAAGSETVAGHGRSDAGATMKLTSSSAGCSVASACRSVDSDAASSG